MPSGEPVELDVRLESVTEGVYVSGTVRAPLTGECARCLDELTDDLVVDLGELFAYPDSVTDETTEADELPRVVDELRRPGADRPRRGGARPAAGPAVPCGLPRAVPGLRGAVGRPRARPRA